MFVVTIISYGKSPTVSLSVLFCFFFLFCLFVEKTLTAWVLFRNNWKETALNFNGRNKRSCALFGTSFVDCDWHLYSLVFSLPSLIRKSNLCTFDFQQQHHQTIPIIPFLRVQVVYKAKRKQSLVSLFWISISPNWFICWLDGLFALNTPEPLAWFLLIHLHYFIFLSKHLIIMTSYLSLSIIVHLLSLILFRFFGSFKNPLGIIIISHLNHFSLLKVEFNLAQDTPWKWYSGYKRKTKETITN